MIYVIIDAQTGIQLASALTRKDANDWLVLNGFVWVGMDADDPDEFIIYVRKPNEEEERK